MVRSGPVPGGVTRAIQAGTVLAFFGWCLHHLAEGEAGMCMTLADATAPRPRTGMVTTTVSATNCTSLRRAFTGILLLALKSGSDSVPYRHESTCRAGTLAMPSSSYADTDTIVMVDESLFDALAPHIGNECPTGSGDVRR